MVSSNFATNSLKAADLTYTDAFSEGTKTVHYWRILYENIDSYAYVTVSPEGESLSWGNKQPAKSAKP
jgi:hypothetical protein